MTKQLICISFKNKRKNKSKIMLQRQKASNFWKSENTISAKVETYFRHLLPVVPARNCTFQIFNVIFTLQTLSVCMLFRGGSFFNSPKLNKISCFLFIPQAWPAFPKYALKIWFPFFSAEFFNLYEAPSLWF